MDQKKRKRGRPKKIQHPEKDAQPHEDEHPRNREPLVVGSYGDSSNRPDPIRTGDISERGGLSRPGRQTYSQRTTEGLTMDNWSDGASRRYGELSDSLISLESRKRRLAI